MSTINISLPDKLKVEVDQQVQAGYYVSFSDLVRTAIRQLLGNGRLPLKAELNKEKITSFCREKGIKSLKLFGSLARGQARPDSDADLLVEFNQDKIPGLFGLIEMENELSQEFHRPVELITKLNKYIEPYAKKDIVTLYEKK